MQLHLNQTVFLISQDKVYTLCFIKLQTKQTYNQIINWSENIE